MSVFFRDRLLHLADEYEALEMHLQSVKVSCGIEAGCPVGSGTTSPYSPFDLKMQDLHKIQGVYGHDGSRVSLEEPMSARTLDSARSDFTNGSGFCSTNGHANGHHGGNGMDQLNGASSFVGNPKPLQRSSKFFPMAARRSTRIHLAHQADVLKGMNLHQHEREEGVSKFRYVVQRIVASKWFDRFIVFCIVVNVCYLGVVTDYNMNHLGKVNIGFQYIDWCFGFIYCVELVLRIIASGRRFFTDEQTIGWNLMDTMLVLQFVVEFLNATVFLGFSGLGQMFVLRTMRVMKSLKMIRVLRAIRSHKELRMILYAIMGSMKSMFWSLVMLSAVLYTFALMFVSATANYLAEQPVEEHIQTIIDKYWSSVLNAMISLFLGVTGGEDYARMLEPLELVGFFYYMMFLLFVFFFTFVILNAITSIFVETTISNSNKDFKHTIQQELLKKEEYIASLNLLFHELNGRRDGEITYDDFQDAIQKPSMAAFASSLEIEVSDAQHFFRVLSQDGTKTVDMDTFVSGCIRMKGLALAVDMQDFRLNYDKASGENKTLLFACVNNLQGVQAMVAAMQTHMKENQATIAAMHERMSEERIECVDGADESTLV